MRKTINSALYIALEKIKNPVMIRGLRNAYSSRYYFVDKHSHLKEIICRKTMKSVDVVSKHDEKFN